MGSWPSGDEVEVEVAGCRPAGGRARTGTLGARDGGVTFTPDDIRLGGSGALDPSLQGLLSSQFTFQVPLPDLPAGVRLERVDTRPGTVVLQGRAASVGVDA